MDAFRYDKMSAYELFKRAGVSKAAYEEFLKPTLLVVREGGQVP